MLSTNLGAYAQASQCNETKKCWIPTLWFYRIERRFLLHTKRCLIFICVGYQTTFKHIKKKNDYFYLLLFIFVTLFNFKSN
ncbi:hypothetical protein HMPREF2533_01091 [Bacteroides fragilis]|uniref:Transmembrane protein n=1 Tax=Bacteroides fragilis (strain ATCC 25285 / DSM 2151 / CCUG 4856 / JCM 11019 / LMG 10263 / NCTC 9343 / Onslow / VPI 2553 / EN-2) TaxID=272559 RepID=Q5LBB5_BACFN|nr:hypothetical protein HMPREF2530_01091 [Bacteroides fragilis]KXU48687.1 hypothetical protein HMPREF2533_01091 [Bacteroides fragilis]CAH08605.1 hypothetical protein BF9343_2824 [Bacteroides fragilis NCTC 9343]